MDSIDLGQDEKAGVYEHGDKPKAPIKTRISLAS
jgi:hypothetical protein